MRCTTLRRALIRAGAIVTVLVLSGGLFAAAASADEPAPPAGTPAPVPTETADPPPADPPPAPAPAPSPEDPAPVDPAPVDPDPAPADPAPTDPTPGDTPDPGLEDTIPGGDVPAGAWPTETDETDTTDGKADTETAEGDPAVDAVADLVIDVEFEDRTYLLNEDVPLTVTVTNTGDAAATSVYGSVSSPYPGPGFDVQSYHWGEFGNFPGAPGGTIDAGETVVIDLIGSTQREGGRPVVTVRLTAANESDPTDNAETFVLTIQSASVLGDLIGTVFGDLDGDDTYDAGEGLAGVRITLSGWYPMPPPATTDAAGRFRFDDLESRVYSAYFEDEPDGWIVDYVYQLPVDGTNPVTDVTFQAVRPLTDRLEASIAFTADTYEVGDVAGLRLVLTNTGTSVIEGIKHGCDRSGGEGPHIALGPEWDVFAWDSPGVTLAAGESRTFDLTGTVPEKARTFGGVDVACDFGPDGQPIDGFPTVYDFARVPGEARDTHGYFWQNLDGNNNTSPEEMIGDVVAQLIEYGTDRVAARAVSGADGRVDFPVVDSGLYEVRVYGPWRIVAPERMFIYVGTCHYCAGGWFTELEPGPNVPEPTQPPQSPSPTTPPTPSTPKTTAPPAQGGVTPGGGGLADTGASVAGLSVVGLLTLALGLVTVLFTRRRRAAA